MPPRTTSTFTAIAGTGKSSSLQQQLAKFGIPVQTIPLSSTEPVDFVGVPVPASHIIPSVPVDL